MTADRQCLEGKRERRQCLSDFSCLIFFFIRPGFFQNSTNTLIRFSRRKDDKTLSRIYNFVPCCQRNRSFGKSLRGACSLCNGERNRKIDRGQNEKKTSGEKRKEPGIASHVRYIYVYNENYKRISRHIYRRRHSNRHFQAPGPYPTGFTLYILRRFKKTRTKYYTKAAFMYAVIFNKG